MEKEKLVILKKFGTIAVNKVVKGYKVGKMWYVYVFDDWHYVPESDVENDSHYKTNAHGRSGVMYASELMEKVIKEPEKYEGKRYKGYPIKDADGNNYEELIVKNGNLCIDDGDDWAYINSHTQLEEIPQPVTWQEALEAFAKGKRIKLVIPGLIQGETVEHIFKDTKTFMLQSDKRYILTADTFLNGTWYILD